MPAATATTARLNATVFLSGTTTKLIARTIPATRSTERMPPRLSTALCRLVHVARNERDGQEQRHGCEGERDEEHRAPPEVLEQRAGDERTERGDRTPERRPERDRAGPTRTGPERRDQCERRRERHPRGDAAEQACEEQDLDRGRVGGEQACRNRETDAEDEHHLAAVAVAERTEPEDRSGQAERVADRDEVEAGLSGVEVLADLGQGDVGHGEVQVRDRGDEDEREQHEALPVGRGRLLVPADARGLSHREDPKG